MVVAKLHDNCANSQFTVLIISAANSRWEMLGFAVPVVPSYKNKIPAKSLESFEHALKLSI